MSEEESAPGGPDAIETDAPGEEALDGREAQAPESTADARPASVEEPGSAAPEDAAGASPARDPDSPEELARALAEARREAQTHRDTVLRTRAEIENVRKRAQRDVANAHKYGLERFVNEFLPVRDSLELGVSAAKGDTDVARVREGIELTLKLMEDAFGKLGLEVIDPAGEAFDPEVHQAMLMQEGGEGQSGNVLTVIQKGYRLNGRLVRPALVVVAK